MNADPTPTAQIDAYRQDRGPAWCRVFDTLREHRLSNMVDEDGAPYPLVDLLTADGCSIDEGEMQMVDIADAICLAAGIA